ncbi:hypothetical protein GNIT_3150 [Glaciecola nitratireducens FR1064]|uniref:Uncharacterized protein n=1 Tax=Glaciecola nitratireducens (strain JCM 12485 / KCTC 12276 / FR1064) TaxID=1085623 RepID=G4QJA2_GLANF|nr:hypothetical protein GNIT_3150 [Glaciecola nitratireducens FR1064]
MNIAVYAKTKTNEECDIKLTRSCTTYSLNINKSLSFTVVEVHTGVILFH